MSYHEFTKLAILSLAFAATLGIGTSCNAAEKKIIMRYSHSSAAAVQEPHHEAALLFEKLVEKSTNGKVDVQIYPGSQLGGEERTYQDIQHRVVQIGSMAVNNAALFSPSLLVFDLPYIFPSTEACYKVMDENWDAVNERMIQESGNMAIAWLVQGFRVISNSKHPVKRLEDLKGLKIRVPNNPLMIDTFRAWGCDPTPMAWDETFNALQQKVVDGQENPYTVFASNKFEEVQKYISNVHYKMWLGPVVINAGWFKKQPEDVQKAILDAGKEVTKANRALIAQMEANLVAELKSKGVIFNELEDESKWQEASMKIWPSFYDKLPDITLLDAIMKSLNMQRPK